MGKEISILPPNPSFNQCNDSYKISKSGRGTRYPRIFGMGVLNILGSKYPVTPASFTLEWIVQHTVMPEVLCDKLNNL